MPEPLVLDIETVPDVHEPFVDRAALLANVRTANGKPTDHPEKTAEGKELLAKAAEGGKIVVDRPALHAETGRVVLVGLLGRIGQYISMGATHPSEGYMLEICWESVADELRAGRRIITHGGHRFDFPFLVRRSWKNHIIVPHEIYSERYGWNPQIKDTLVEWQQFDRGEYITLDRLAAALGVGRKTAKGGDFSELWHSDRTAAFEYNEQDLRLTLACAERMGLVVEDKR